MQNINVGDRVVDKTTGKHGKVDSFIRPWTFGVQPKVKARVVLDNGNIVDVEPHNLAIEEGYKKPVYDNQGINKLKNPEDPVENLTPKKTRKSKKSAVDEIVEATE